MNKIKVLLLCGSGASSGFMAANMKREAVKMNMDLSVIARSESEIDDYIDDCDCVMLGPHLKYLYNDFNEEFGNKKKIILMKSGYYSKLSGKEAIEHMLDEIQKEGGNNDE